MVEVASCCGKEAAVARLQGLCPLRSVSLPSVSPSLRTASPGAPLPEAHMIAAQFAEASPINKHTCVVLLLVTVRACKGQGSAEGPHQATGKGIEVLRSDRRKQQRAGCRAACVSESWASLGKLRLSVSLNTQKETSSSSDGRVRLGASVFQLSVGASMHWHHPPTQKSRFRTGASQSHPLGKSPERPKACPLEPKGQKRELEMNLNPGRQSKSTPVSQLGSADFPEPPDPFQPLGADSSDLFQNKKGFGDPFSGKDPFAPSSSAKPSKASSLGFADFTSNIRLKACSAISVPSEHPVPFRITSRTAMPWLIEIAQDADTFLALGDL
ncbi:hypothetical protein J1605_008474 [Eschrichtius robustus]|uniref:Uncharacterized protein n=1 Tax=Eschrichtius robustus TaxID=9764 RepID=A0AB34H0F1_ESCRO|nr:hypothetical protein J1605_008474 [Eschrichtius robustus]